MGINEQCHFKYYVFCITHIICSEFISLFIFNSYFTVKLSEIQMCISFSCVNKIHVYLLYANIPVKCIATCAITSLLPSAYRITGIFCGWEFLRFGPQTVAF